MVEAVKKFLSLDEIRQQFSPKRKKYSAGGGIAALKYHELLMTKSSMLSQDLQNGSKNHPKKAKGQKFDIISIET